MNQKNPLLNYRIKCNAEECRNVEEISYDFTTGLWKDELGEPIIKRYINDSKLYGQGETLITESREGVDRSEMSNIQIGYQQENNNNNKLTALGESLITRTRESVDRSENSCETNENMSSASSSLNFAGETLLTKTREGIDRSSECSGYDNSNLESMITFTRESVDRSEKS